jgi:thiol:disulfide interchange protein DsbD
MAIAAALAGHAAAAPVAAAHLTAELVARTQGAAPGTTLWVAVVQKIDKGWHTYWRNPGDAGEATSVAWTLPAGWRAGAIVWPPPRRLPVGPLMNYGYEGQVLLPTPIFVPRDAPVGRAVTLLAHAGFLVCAEVCVPTDARLALTLPVIAGRPAPDPRWGEAIDRTLATAPRPAGLTASFTQTGRALKIAIAGRPLAGLADAGAYFYPYDDKLIDHAAPQAIERGASGLTLTTVPGVAFAHGVAPASAAGVLAVGGRVWEVAAAPGPPPAGSFGLGPPIAPPATGMGLALALVFAFVGGLILNLMPCVFPILAMKAAALAGHPGEARRARRQGVAFLVGVLAAFLILAIALIAAKAAGTAIGWGFQLQSPTVVAGLGLVMLAAGLNLSGLYEIGTSVQGLASRPAARGDWLGSALTGVLAVVVAAPCTAPFMGPALGWALTQSAPAALAVFTGLGLGFAAPFAVIAFVPALTARLPKPGAWMDSFRRALAFPMYGAAAWLAWVLARQAGADGLARLLAGALALAFAAWLFGAAQRASLAGRRAASVMVLASLALAVSLAAVFAGPYRRPAPLEEAAAVAAPGALASQPYSPGSLAALRQQGRPVLVNFTAAWCVTCQVNERIAFASARVAAAFARSRAAYLVADWTDRDPQIAQALAAQGRIGVPLYLVYDAAGDPPAVLPQILTPGLVAGALDAAAARPTAGAAR